MIRMKDLAGAELISCEETLGRMYLCIGDRRYIFDDGKYVGWYRP